MKSTLGNSRVNFSDLNQDGKIEFYGVEKEVVQENHYYPFGMNMEGEWAQQIGPNNKYQYNGKELNDDFGLNWNDYGARWYDAAIGRWNAVDPLAEMIHGHSPYTYVFNDPISFNDPTGMMGQNIASTHVDTKGNFIWHYNDGDNNIYVHDIGTTKNDVDNARSEQNNTSGGGDNARGNSKRAREYQENSARIYLASMLNRGEITPEEYLMAWNASYGEYGAMGMQILQKYKWDFASYIPWFAWLKWGRVANVAKGPASFLNSLKKTISVQKQARHLVGTAGRGKGYLNSIDDAQAILDAVHSGKATFLGTSKAGHQVFRFKGVTGTNVNLGKGITSQPTNIFMIKGTKSPSIVPTSPVWTP